MTLAGIEFRYLISQLAFHAIDSVFSQEPTAQGMVDIYLVLTIDQAIYRECSIGYTFPWKDTTALTFLHTFLS